MKHYMNAFGEEVIVDNSDKAIAIAAQKTGAIVIDYTAAPIYFSDQSNGAHEWLVEFEKEPDSLQQFTLYLDEALKNINSDYEAKRHRDIALSLPRVSILPNGSFTRWLRSKNKIGGQHKVPRLSNERIILEEILAIARNHS
ncbi:MAG: GH3 auxin-responsive promoter family protein [Ferruginibacter sp.]